MELTEFYTSEMYDWALYIFFHIENRLIFLVLQSTIRKQWEFDNEIVLE